MTTLAACLACFLIGAVANQAYADLLFNRRYRLRAQAARERVAAEDRERADAVPVTYDGADW